VLFPMNAFRLMIVMGGGLAAAAAPDYCSLVARVVDSRDNPVSGVWAEAQESSGRTVSRMIEQGEVSFCDLGVSGVTISVGTGGCQTVMRKLPLEWGLSLNIKLVYDPQPCRVDSPPPILPCAVLFRFSDASGRWLPSVSFKPVLPRSPDLRGDSYGRAMVRMARGEEIHTTTILPGYLPEAIDLKCPNQPPGPEVTIILRKSQ
jgi:hypothetical protein